MHYAQKTFEHYAQVFANLERNRGKGCGKNPSRPLGIRRFDLVAMLKSVRDWLKNPVRHICVWSRVDRKSFACAYKSLAIWEKPKSFKRRTYTNNAHAPNSAQCVPKLCNANISRICLKTFGRKYATELGHKDTIWAYLMMRAQFLWLKSLGNINMHN